MYSASWLLSGEKLTTKSARIRGAKYCFYECKDIHHTISAYIKGPILTVWNASGKAQSASSFVGGSTALSLFYRRINDACAMAQVSKGLVWSSLITRRCGLGVTCNKPMRVPAPIPFKSHERIWIGRVDILTARLQSPMRQMHMNLQMA